MTSLPWEMIGKSAILFLAPVLIRFLGPGLTAECRVWMAIATFGSAILLAGSVLFLPEYEINGIPVPSRDDPPVDESPYATGALGSTATFEPLGSTHASRLPPWLTLYGGVTSLLLLITSIRCFKQRRWLTQLPVSTDPTIGELLEQLRLQLGLRVPVQLRVQPAIPSPIAAGILHPVIAIPADFGRWTVHQQRVALLHELTHVSRRDFAILRMSQLVTILFWWQPLAWLTLLRLRSDLEEACDDAVVNAGISPTQYAEQLLAVARRRTFGGQGGLPMAAGALKRRIEALLDYEHRRLPMSTSARSIFMAVASTIAVGLGSGQLAAQMADRDYLPIFKPTPDYPREAQEQQVEGFVLLEFDIDATGATRNIRVIEQEPASGIFEAPAIDATRSFRYLPKRLNGRDVTVTGVRNRITFALGESADHQSDVVRPFQDLAELTVTRERSKLDLVRRLARAAELAEAERDGDAFLALGEMAQEVPSMAEYLLLRASQLGTSDAPRLQLALGITFFKSGSLERAGNVFARLAAQPSAQSMVAEKWLEYVDREIARRAALHDALLTAVP